jgi:hypothetical protein
VEIVGILVWFLILEGMVSVNSGLFRTVVRSSKILSRSRACKPGQLGLRTEVRKLFCR